MRSRSSTRVRSSARRTLVATVDSQALTRSGGSSLVCSTSIARLPALESSRPYSSDTYDLSLYDVSSFSAT